MFGCCGEMKRMIYFLEMQSENVLWRSVCVDDLSYLNQKRKWEEEEIV